MDLRIFGITPEQAKLGAKLLDYQPFILSDDLQTGIAYDWLYGDTDRYGYHDPGRYVVDKSTVPAEVWERFASANGRLRFMYDQWIEQICSRARRKNSVTDIACNSGYFLQRFAQRGFKTCIGYDRLDKSECFEFLGEITGLCTHFVHKAYDSWQHSIDGCEPADVVIASAIMVHLSDPLYFLKFLADMTIDTLFLFTSVAHSADYSIYYHAPNKYDKEAQFPICFDVNWVSVPLLMLGLERTGFKNVTEVVWNDSWLPQEWAKDYKFLICQK